MMVGLILYAYATGERSSRGIERHCRQDVAYRVISANLVPDHATIARFICRHEQALSELFSSVLALCAKAGLVKAGDRGDRWHEVARERQPGFEL